MDSSDAQGQVSVDCVVIGAGVTGLAVGRALAMSGRQVAVLEAASTFGAGISSRNSEVIHGGIYYSTGSLKAHYCIRGRDLLYRYCESRGVPYRRLGKLIVATTDAEITQLEQIAAQARANGVA